MKTTSLLSPVAAMSEVARLLRCQLWQVEEKIQELRGSCVVVRRNAGVELEDSCGNHYWFPGDIRQVRCETEPRVPGSRGNLLRPYQAGACRPR